MFVLLVTGTLAAIAVIFAALRRSSEDKGELRTLRLGLASSFSAPPARRNRR